MLGPHNRSIVRTNRLTTTHPGCRRTTSTSSGSVLAVFFELRPSTHRGGRKLAGGLGFEPRLTESESAVLPLDDPPAARLMCERPAFGEPLTKHVTQIAALAKLVRLNPRLPLRDDVPAGKGIQCCRREAVGLVLNYQAGRSKRPASGSNLTFSPGAANCWCELNLFKCQINSIHQQKARGSDR